MAGSYSWVFEPARLAAQYRDHLLTRQALDVFLDNPYFSSEGWFQVEFTSMLVQSGWKAIPGYSYPQRRLAADVGVLLQDQSLVLVEMKCFVHGADQNKREHFPKQLQQLRACVEEGSLVEGIAIATFSGYKNRTQPLWDSLIGSPWSTVPLTSVQEDLWIGVAIFADSHAL